MEGWWTMTTYENVVSVFESIIKSKYVLADGLVQQWFYNAVGEFELNIGKLGYSIDETCFLSSDGNEEFFDKKGNLQWHVILTLAEIMKSYYMQQERRRVNQLNNVIGKDISLNGTGDTKKYTAEEADNTDWKVADFFQKQKPPAYN